MKRVLACGLAGWVGWLMLLLSVGLVRRCKAQDNVWTNSASGNWQDAAWSLGKIPGTNQTVWLTNAGWKALQIGSATAQNFPQSLNVNAVMISSPTNTFNTLLLNFAGLGTPLTVKALSVASNSAMVMFSSALQINGPNGAGMTIGGEFDQNNSMVAGNQVNVGYIGPGVYNLNSGTVAVSQLWVGGQFFGILNQSGGTNAFGITHLDGGEYALSNGYYAATIYFNGGEFRQEGGLLNSDLTIFEGNYLLNGGVHQGDAIVPSSDGFSSGDAGMVQAGGTNYGSLDIGTYGFGDYTLSNGVSIAGGISVNYKGDYNQFGGTQMIGGMINIGEQMVAQNAYEGGWFNLHGGQVSSSGMFVGAYYTQTGGTNLIAGDVTIQGAQTSFSVSGGFMTANNIIATPGFMGGIDLTGGTLVVSNELVIGGNQIFPQWHGFLGGGQLFVSDIRVAPQASFSCRDGAIFQSGTLTLANASLFGGSGLVRFGRLCLSSEGNSNSTIFMPAGASVLNFADSSGMTWSNTVVLTVEGWNGSLYGGGQQQIIFGTNACSLTAAQVGQIQFHNPAGVAAGTYGARLLANGELVPNAVAAQSASVALAPRVEGMQVTLRGEAGRSYCIEVSSDLVHWMTWTNQVNSTGIMSLTDTDATNHSARFYRARLVR